MVFEMGLPLLDLKRNSVAVAFGTRPEIIKLARIVELLGPAARVVHNGQYYDITLSGVLIDGLGLADPDLQLDVGGITRGRQKSWGRSLD